MYVSGTGIPWALQYCMFVSCAHASNQALDKLSQNVVDHLHVWDW
jgi:hypothetical protein